MIGKYKLIGILAGAAATSYGGYEIYNQFAPSLTTTPNLGNKKEIQNSKEKEPNSNLLDKKEQSRNTVENNVVVEPEVQKPKEKQLKSQVSVPQAHENSVSKTQPSSNLSQTNDKHENYRYRMQRQHLNEDGTIKLLPRTMGSDKFKNDVITARKEDKVWENKVRAWKYDLEQHERLKKDKKEHRNPVPSEFLPRGSQKVDAETIQRMCANSYRKKS